MRDTLSEKLYERELLANTSRSKSFRKLYSDRQMIDKLDIVNELDGHSGCVNALSWSRSGQLLASGSDDQHLNIHKYQPGDSDSQFQFSTTVATGHTQNIFSVKFMPHHNDRKVITAAGDGEVRVFDLEYAGGTRSASTASAMATEGRRSRRNNVYNGVRYLSDGDTDCRVYRSHGDRVKRIVVENSPHLFLTCSEDGEVRQWDMRQPSSAYPAPRGGRFGATFDNSLPPPLISYKRYQLDLNSISCSPSRPHYIALGGAHLHAFLHDRRMVGRDRLREAGKPLSPAGNMSSDEEEAMSEATQCVRKFAPDGRGKMERSDNGHITALKISDSRPHEMVVSWSGDHIYSFDLNDGFDKERPQEAEARLNSSSTKRVRPSGERKRKRRVNDSETSLPSQVAAARGSSQPREDESEGEGHDTALRVRYQNGQSEDIPIQSTHQRRPGTFLTDKEQEAQQIAKTTIQVRSALFASSNEGHNSTARFTAALGLTARILEDMDDVMQGWGYPIDPEMEMVSMQRTLRQNRESARRLIQAAGTLARALGGKIQTTSGTSPMMAHFSSIESKTTEMHPSRREQFGYDFLKAILLWLESGIGRLIEGFTRPLGMSPTAKASQRLPIPEDEASLEAIDEFLIPYLLRLASDNMITNVDVNQFEVDENRRLFSSEKSAVQAFAAAIKIPFADLSSAVMHGEGTSEIQAQDRQTAMRYWGLKVARGVLLNAAEGVDYIFVSRAFGGPSRVVRQEAAGGDWLFTVSEENDEAVNGVDIVDEHGQPFDGATADDMAPALRAMREANNDATLPDEEMANSSEMSVLSLNNFEDAEHQQPTFENAGDSNDDDDHDEGHDDESEDDDTVESESHESDDEDDSESAVSEEDGVPNLGLPRFMMANAGARRRMRDKVNAHVPCTSATRRFSGHCNVKTVKDVNYFGLDDEYVVSGSDDGNFFIWDSKTGELLNVLEGDGEVVNVVQGHPHETTLAVSGIDHTIKIFSPDSRARAKARLGDGVASHDSTGFSSLSWPSRVGRHRVSRQRTTVDQQSGLGVTTSEPAVPAHTATEDCDHDSDEEFVAPSGLSSRRRMHDSYRITSQNDVERQGGNTDTFLTLPRAQLLQLLLQLGPAALA